MSIVPQLILNSIIAGAIYTLVALGFNLIYGTTKFFNLAHGALAAVGAYAVFFFVYMAHLPLLVGVVLGVITAGVGGYALNMFVYEKLRKRKASHMALLVASLGAFSALQALIAMLFTSQFRTLSKSVGAQARYHIGAGVITETQLVMFIVGLVSLAGLATIIHTTRFGASVRAINDDEEVAKIVGINTSKIIGHVFFIGSAFAGLAGIFVGFDTGLEPTMGLQLLLKGVIASIVGGVGSIYGGVLGAFLLGFIENFGIWKISGEWKDAIAFGVLIVFLIVRPEGIIKR